MIRCTCPHCRKSLRLADDARAGTEITCPTCQGSFRVPRKRSSDDAIRTDAAENDDTPKRNERRGEVNAPRKKDQAPRKRSKHERSSEGDMASLRNRIVGGVALLIGVALAIAGAGEYFPQGAVDQLGMDWCKYASIGFGGLLVATGVVYLIRG